ncbi:hypothetical protein J2X35_002623 [Mesorhizobium sp. BE184]|nr:hypothetical protein [Mesorhizobium sp. BE184]
MGLAEDLGLECVAAGPVKVGHCGLSLRTDLSNQGTEMGNALP